MKPIELIKSPLHGTIELFQRGLNALGVVLSPKEVEGLGILIYDVMEARWRKYHVIEHVLSICDTRDPIQILAGLFHDVVYLQIDRRIHPKLVTFLSEVAINSSQGYSFEVPKPHGLSSTDFTFLVNYIFGKTPGQILTPMNGGNEYLSALVFARVLGERLASWDLIKIIGCIEATIPFRKSNEKGESPSAQLEDKLRKLVELNKLNQTEKSLLEAIKSSVELANRDVIGFSFKDPLQFNSQTWQLIMEGNPVFKNPMYTISQYLSALIKVESFYGVLNPGLIYRECSHPDFNIKEVKRMRERAIQNLALGREYFQMRIISNYILLAVAELTGGDSALVFFTGQVERDEKHRSVLLEYFLDKSVPEVDDSKRNSIVLNMLSDVLYDAIHKRHKKETLSAYLFVRLTTEERLQLFSRIKENIDKKEYYLEFLKNLNKEICYSLVYAISQMASTRSHEFKALLKDLGFTYK